MKRMHAMLLAAPSGELERGSIFEVFLYLPLPGMLVNLQG